MKLLYRIILIGSCFSLLAPRMVRAEVPEVVLQTIAMESAGESLEGQSWVAKTIQSRAERGKTSPQQVVLRPKQFSCWNDRQGALKWLKRHYSAKVRQSAIKAWNTAYSLPLTPTHYHAAQVHPYWAKGKTPCVVIGNHLFYEGIK